MADLSVSDLVDLPPTPVMMRAQTEPPTPTPQLAVPNTPLSPRKAYSEEQIEHQISDLLSEFLMCHDVGEAMQCVQDLQDRRPETWTREMMHSKVVKEVVAATLEKRDKEREQCHALVQILWVKKTISSQEILDGMGEIMSFLEDLALDVPRAPKHFADILALLLQCDALQVKEVCDLVVPTFEDVAVLPLDVALHSLSVAGDWEVTSGQDKVEILLTEAGLKRTPKSVLHSALRQVDANVLFGKYPSKLPNGSL